MSGGDPRLSISDTVPQINERQVARVLTAISRRPREHWAELVAMLGLDGRPVIPHRSGRVVEETDTVTRTGMRGPA